MLRFPSVARLGVLLALFVTLLACGLFLFDKPSSGAPSTPHTTKRVQSLRVANLRQRLRDYYPADYNRNAYRFNLMALDRLAACLETNTCDSDKVMLLASHHFGQSRVGFNAGEEVWAHSVHLALDSLNYTLLYVLSDSEMLLIHQAIGDMIPVIFSQPSILEHCIERNNTNYLDIDWRTGFPPDWQRPGHHGCIKKQGFEDGIPLWKFLSWAWWESAMHPLGKTWTVGPEDWGKFKFNEGNTYLGYSVEDRCRTVPYFEKREHRGIVLAKKADYFTDPKIMAWPNLLAPVAKSVSKDENGDAFEFLATASGNLRMDSVRNTGPLDRDVWLKEVAKSKFMLGIGRPFLSPSPYDALCSGVPFINVVYSRDNAHPDNKRAWRTQHDALIFLEPPYVYHVLQKNEEELRAAIQSAIDNPIPRFIPPEMTLAAVAARHQEIATRDWQTLASQKYPEMFEPNGEYLY